MQKTETVSPLTPNWFLCRENWLQQVVLFCWSQSDKWIVMNISSSFPPASHSSEQFHFIKQKEGKTDESLLSLYLLDAIIVLLFIAGKKCEAIRMKSP